MRHIKTYRIFESHEKTWHDLVISCIDFEFLETINDIFMSERFSPDMDHLHDEDYTFYIEVACSLDCLTHATIYLDTLTQPSLSTPHVVPYFGRKEEKLREQLVENGPVYNIHFVVHFVKRQPYGGFLGTDDEYREVNEELSKKITDQIIDRLHNIYDFDLITDAYHNTDSSEKDYIKLKGKKA